MLDSLPINLFDAIVLGVVLLSALVALLRGYGHEPFVVTVGFDGAAAEPGALAAVARGHGWGATPAGSVSDALDMALRFGAGRVAICGSLYLAGEVLGASRETWPT